MMRSVRLAILALTLLLVAPAAVVAKDSPSAVLRQSVDEVLTVLQEPAYRNSATRKPLRTRIEKLVQGVFDFNEFSARTVGSSWPSFTDQQKKQFDEAFADLLLSTYLDKVEGYNGEKIEYTGEIVSQKGDRAEVKTVVTLSDGKKVPVAYRMMAKNDKWVVYDVLIENISLIKNYRSQFAEVLTNGTPDQLIERVRARVKALQNEKAA